jgi:hypothetical protein
MFTENPSIARFMAVELRQSPEFYEKYRNTRPSPSTGLHQEAVRPGGGGRRLTSINTEAMAMLIFGTIDFVITEWSVKGRAFSLEKLKDDILDLVRYGTRPR